MEAGGRKPGKYNVAEWSFEAGEEYADHEFFQIARENRNASFRTTAEWWAAMQPEVVANMQWEEKQANLQCLPSSSSTQRDPAGYKNLAATSRKRGVFSACSMLPRDRYFRKAAFCFGL